MPDPVRPAVVAIREVTLGVLPRRTTRRGTKLRRASARARAEVQVPSLIHGLQPSSVRGHDESVGMKSRSLVAIGVFTAVVPTTLLWLGVNMLFGVPLVIGLACVVVGARATPVPDARALFDVGDAEFERVARDLHASRRIRNLGAIACLAATALPFAISQYFGREGQPIRIVLPAGYRGEFSIVKNRSAGQPLQEESGTWIFRIPESGTLVINDDFPFYMPHKPETVVDTAGHPVRVVDLGTTIGKVWTGTGWKGSTKYDGTTLRWRVAPPPH